MDIYSTMYLNGVVDNLKRPATFLMTMFFSMISVATEEEIKFDVASGKRRISPFVSPLREGKLVESLGYTTNTFKPAYVKDKRVIDPNKPLKRLIGEQIGGNLAPVNREQAIVVNEVQDQTQMLTRRQEVMASEALRTGKVTVTGDGFDTVVVDFGRNANHTITLASGSKWGETGVSPHQNIEDWALTVLQNSGAEISDVVMGIGAFREYKQDQAVKDALDLRRASGDAELESLVKPIQGAKYQGRVGGFNIWTYSDWYVDPATDTETAIFPTNGVLLASPQVEGVRHYGAIRDPEAGYQAREIFTKSWITKDPAQRLIMSQSAPLTVPYRPDATLYATVK